MAGPSKGKIAAADAAALLADKLSDALVNERLVPRFVDSYVVEHGRYGLQVHAGLYRDLLTLLQREALIAVSVTALDLANRGELFPANKKLLPLKRKEAAEFRKKFVSALTRKHRWNAGQALEFQSDLQMYEDILARAALPRRKRKPFETANHPFVDRCAFLLDSSFLEKARLAASHALTDLEELTTHSAAGLLDASKSGPGNL
jgi:hypothetical protein